MTSELFDKSSFIEKWPRIRQGDTIAPTVCLERHLHDIRPVPLSLGRYSLKSKNEETIQLGIMVLKNRAVLQRLYNTYVYRWNKWTHSAVLNILGDLKFALQTTLRILIRIDLYSHSQPRRLQSCLNFIVFAGVKFFHINLGPSY